MLKILEKCNLRGIHCFIQTKYQILLPSHGDPLTVVYIYTLSTSFKQNEIQMELEESCSERSKGAAIYSVCNDTVPAAFI